MNDLPELHEIALNEDEKQYLQKAINSGVQSTEILNVLVLRRLTTYVLGNLVGAMETPNFVVYKITPFDV